MQWILIFIFSAFFLLGLTTQSLRKGRKYESVNSVASSYDSWTNDRLLENLWGEHIHLGFYEKPRIKKDFRKAKVDFVHELVRWSGLNQLPKGSRVLDVGCGIGGSSRILSDYYGFDVIGISISQEQVKRAYELDYSRNPDDEELKLGVELSKKHGLSALGRVLFNSNEFVVIE